MIEFKQRASSCGLIMGAKGLGKTGESALKMWLKEQTFNRRKEFSSKYTQKGNICEDNSIDFIAEMLGFGFLIKNEKYFENDFIKGTPDVILTDLIIDVKNSWDWSTFPFFENEIPNSDYYWQAQCYMELCDIDNYKLIYILSDTPENIIISEARKYCYQNGIDPEDNDVYDEFIAKMTYSDIEDSKKIKVFDISRNREDYAKIITRVLESRKYLLTLNK